MTVDLYPSKGSEYYVKYRSFSQMLVIFGSVTYIYYIRYEVRKFQFPFSLRIFRIVRWSVESFEFRYETRVFFNPVFFFFCPGVTFFSLPLPHPMKIVVYFLYSKSFPPSPFLVFFSFQMRCNGDVGMIFFFSNTSEAFDFLKRQSGEIGFFEWGKYSNRKNPFFFSCKTLKRFYTSIIGWKLWKLR